MTWNGSVLNIGRPLPDRDGINDLSAPSPIGIGPDRAPQSPARPQVIHQFLFQHPAGLNEETSIDRLVRHSQALVVRKLIFSQPEICSGDQSNSSLLATMRHSFRLLASKHFLGRSADRQA